MEAKAREGYSEEYHEELRLLSIKAQEGTITEVKFTTEVLLDSQQRYRISAEVSGRIEEFDTSHFLRHGISWL